MDRTQYPHVRILGAIRAGDEFGVSADTSWVRSVLGTSLELVGMIRAGDEFGASADTGCDPCWGRVWG